MAYLQPKMGHHKIRILTLPFIFFIGFIIYGQFFGNGYFTEIEKINYSLTAVGLGLILVNYFVIKTSRPLQIATAFLSLICLLFSAFFFFQILIGAADGDKNIYILFMIPFVLYLVYAYYELFD